MSTLAEIEAVIPQLTKQEFEEFRRWFEGYVQGMAQLENKRDSSLGQLRLEDAAESGLSHIKLLTGEDGLPLIRADRGVITMQRVMELENLPQ